MAHWYSIDFCSASSHMDNCGESRANSDAIPDFWGRLVCISHSLDADSALPFGGVMMIWLIVITRHRIGADSALPLGCAMMI